MLKPPVDIIEVEHRTPRLLYLFTDAEGLLCLGAFGDSEDWLNSNSEGVSAVLRAVSYKYRNRLVDTRLRQLIIVDLRTILSIVFLSARFEIET